MRELVKPSFVISASGHSDVLAERQSAQMSKSTNDGLTRSVTGVGRFIAVLIRQHWAPKC